jgi:hypothetical protein
MRTVADYFTKLRREHPAMRADQAHRWAKHEHAVDLLERESDSDWRTSWSTGAPFIVVRVPAGDELHGKVIELRVYNDDEVYDWGDIEPTEQEREDLEVIGLGVGLPGEEDLETVWGYGYTSGDPEREALSWALGDGFIDVGRRELAERERLKGFVETVDD